MIKQPRKLWAHQQEAVERASKLGNFGLFFAPGTGKTATVINILRNKCNVQKKLLKTLVFCPPIVVQNWKNEFALNSNIPPGKVTCLTGTGKKRLETFLNHKDPSHIFITNYETMSMEVFEEFLKWEPECLIFDESQRLINYTSKRSKCANQLANGRMTYEKRFGTYSGPRPLVYILSGSPILNSPMDIFQQYKILDAGATFGANFFAFRAKYFRDKNAGMPKHNYFPNWVALPHTLEEIGALLDKNSMRVKKETCLDLPPLVRQKIMVGMTKEQEKLYTSMLNDYVAVFESKGEDKVAMATMALTKSLRLMQIASGYIKTVDGQEVNITGKKYNPKQEALYEILQDLPEGTKVIIWAVWKQNYVQIRQVLNDLKLKFLEINGEQGSAKNRANAEEFERDPQITAMIAHPESGGEGINLVSASYSIYFSRTYSLRQDIQSEARNYRGGSEQHSKITRIDLVSEGTVEEKILERLANKQEVGENILREITCNLINRRQS